MDLVSKKLQSLERMIGHDYERVAGGEYTGDTVLEQVSSVFRYNQPLLFDGTPTTPRQPACSNCTSL